jgi:Flp pilus assembly protein TadB
VLIWVVVAISLGAGVPLPIVAAIAVVGVSPVLGTGLLVAVVAGYGWWRRIQRKRGRSEAALFREIAGDVAAGSSLREAIVRCESSEVSATVRRLCASGASLAAIGAEMADSLPLNGRRFAALCSMTEHSGAGVVDAMETFATSATAEEELNHKRRSSLAQARMSAWVVGLAPLALTGVLVMIKGIPEPGGASVVIPMVIGGSLQVVGTAIVFVVSGRAVG